MDGMQTNYYGKKIIMQQENNNLERIKNLEILKILNLATLVSIAMLLFYGLGAYKHIKEIKKLK
jgi:hypothetical protein